MNDLEKVRATNRELMPKFTEAYDSLSEAFGPLKVIYAEENGRKVGVEPDDSDLVTLIIEPKETGDSWGRIRK
jgi:hypothetical protein